MVAVADVVTWLKKAIRKQKETKKKNLPSNY
jgi:hypothetical protein